MRQPIPSLRFSRALWTILVFCFVGEMIQAQQQLKVFAPHHPVPPKLAKSVPLPAPESGSIVGGPWMIDANLKSTIYVKNLVETSAVTVTPILYLSNGVKYALASMTLDPAGITAIDVNSTLQKLGIAPYATLTARGLSSESSA